MGQSSRPQLWWMVQEQMKRVQSPGTPQLLQDKGEKTRPQGLMVLRRSG